MSVTVITTLHQDGYNLYGKENLESWCEFFPSDWGITYYAEKHKPEFSNRISVVDFDHHCPTWQTYYDAVKNKLAADPLKTDNKRKNWYKKALRWSFKMYALLDSLKNPKTRYVVWLDADVEARQQPKDQWIEQCLNNACIAGQLEKLKAGGHIETGILIIDTQHPDISKIIDWIELGYVKFKILDEDKAWDGIWMAKLLQTRTVSWRNLQMLELNKTAKPFTHENLSWLSHKVGKRKFDNSNFDVRSGRNKDQELI